MEFLAAFAKLRKAPFSFVTSVLSVCLSVCLPACINKFPTGQMFLKFNIGDIFKNLWRKIKFDTNQTNMSGTLREEITTFYIITTFSLYRATEQCLHTPFYYYSTTCFGRMWPSSGKSITKP